LSDLGLFDLIFDAFNASAGFKWIGMAAIGIVLLILLFVYLQYSVLQAAMFISFILFAGIIGTTLATASWVVSGLVLLIGLSLAYAFYRMFQR
jgi:hypothetical protein